MRTIIPHTKNPILRQVAQLVPVAEIKSTRIQTLVREMKALLAKEEFGVALAAPQVGESLRLFVVSGRALARGRRNAPDEPDQNEEAPPLPDQIYINPVLTKLSRAKAEKHEGCLSVRGKWGTVKRAEKTTIEAYDERGRKFLRGASGFLAHVFQHEMDHLEGILYTDKAVRMYEDNPDEKRAREI